MGNSSGAFRFKRRRTEKVMRKKAVKKKTKEKMNTSTRVLIILGVFALLFILTMIITFWIKGSVPDTLIQYVLGAGGVEALLLAGIKISKVLTESKKEIALGRIKADESSPVTNEEDNGDAFEEETEVVER